MTISEATSDIFAVRSASQSSHLAVIFPLRTARVSWFDLVPVNFSQRVVPRTAVGTEEGVSRSGSGI